MAEGVKTTLSEKDRIFREKSLNGPMWQVILQVGTPLALYQSLKQLFAILDTMMAAHISPSSVSAVAYLSQLNSLISAIGGGLAVGAGIQISRAYGEGNLELMRKRISTVYILCFGLGVLLCGVMLPFAEPFLSLAGTPKGLIKEGAPYFRVQMLCLVLSFINNVYIAVERARGNTRRILILNMAVIITKLSLTAWFVYGLNGDLIMISFATLASEGLLFFMALKNSFEKDSAFGFSAKMIANEKGVLGPVVATSFPVTMEKMLFASGKTVVNSMCTAYGDLMVGAMGVSNNLGGFTTNPQNGFQEGAAAVISQNLGAKKYSRVLEAFYATAVINMILGGIISGLEIANMSALAGLFDGGDPAFRQMIMLVYRYEALGAIPLGFNAAVMALMYGLGKTKMTLLINVSRVFVFRIPVFWFLQNFTNYGDRSVGMVMMISNISVAGLSAVAAFLVIRQFRKNYHLEKETAHPLLSLPDSH